MVYKCVYLYQYKTLLQNILHADAFNLVFGVNVLNIQIFPIARYRHGMTPAVQLESSQWHAIMIEDNQCLRRYGIGTSFLEHLPVSDATEGGENVLVRYRDMGESVHILFLELHAIVAHPIIYIRISMLPNQLRHTFVGYVITGHVAETRCTIECTVSMGSQCSLKRKSFL